MKLTHSKSSTCLAVDNSPLLLKMLFNQQVQSIAILSADGRVLHANDLFLATQNITLDEMMGQLFWKLPLWGGALKWRAIWKQRIVVASNDSIPVLGEDIYDVGDQEKRYADTSTTAIYEPDTGDLAGYLILITELTNRRSAEKQNKETENHLKFSLAHSHVAHWELNLIDHTIQRSLLYDQIFGYESIQSCWTFPLFLQHVIADDRDEIDNKFQAVIEDKKDFRFECQIMRKDGEIRWILVSGGYEISPLIGIPSLVGILQDVTLLKLAQKDKKRHNNELKSLFEALPDTYFRMLEDGTIVDYHTQRKSELYLKPESFLGKRMQDVLPVKLGRLFQEKIEQLFESNGVIMFNYEMMINNKLFHFDASLNKIVNTEQLVCVIRDVTAEFIAKQSLAVSEQLFRTVFEQVAVGVALVDASSGLFTRINQRFCDMLGYRIEEIRNKKTFKEITHPDDLKMGANKLDKILLGQQREVVIEKRYFHKLGHTVWVEVNVSPTWAVGEQSHTLIVVVQEITERKKIDEKIRTKQKQLLQAEAIGKMGSWELNLNSLKNRWSPEIHAILGIKKLPESGPVLIKEVVVPDDWHMVRTRLQSAIKLGSVCEFECRILHPQGEKRWVYCKAERQTDESGHPLSLVGILQDITNRKLEEEMQRLAAAVYKNTSEGVVITNAQGNIVDVNQSFTKMTGYQKEEVIGKNLRILHSGKQDKKFYHDMWKILLSKGQWAGEIWNRRKDGTIYPELLNISRIADDQGHLTHFVGVFSDISKMKDSEAQLYQLAHHDTLTGLPNRLLLNEYLAQAIKRAKRDKSLIAVIFFDLDNFKIINDSFGHAIGDLLLQETARRLVGTLRDSDSASRISGDEFIIILEKIRHRDDVDVIANKLLQIFQKRFSLKIHHVNVTASMGISLYPQDANNPAELLRNADSAMYQAKGLGRNTYKFYNREMTRNAFERVCLENNLREAIQREEFYINYQPQICLCNNQVIGLEALIRWNHPELGVVSPDLFIPLAEETGLILDIGEWVLRTACVQAKKWVDQGLKFGRVAVNIAGPQIKRGNIVNLVKEILEETDLSADYLELEVTESYVMQQTDKAIQQLEALRKLGVMLSIDDFGTGYSSLSYLKKLPINKLKIDQSFIHDIPNDQDDMAISKAVIAMGAALGLKVIAEGVEMKEQAEFLIEAGCHEAQGYLYSKAIDVAAIESFLINFNGHESL